MSQVGATTILGGSGITLNSGQANTNITGGLITVSGARTIFKPSSDSTSSLRIQNASGTTLLAADTTNMIITVTKLNVTGNITVGGHIITGGTAPSIAAGPAACTTPTLAVNGNDTSGTITVTTGTGCASNGILATLTFNTAFGVAPHVILTPGDSGSLALGAYAKNSTVSTTSFQLGTNATPANSTVYQWNYLVVQ
jgi:hypothetical protein